MIEDRVVVAAGLVAERTGKPTFADAGRPEISKLWCRGIQSPATSLANSALSRPRGAFMSTSSTTADWRRLANFNRLTSFLFSRSIASRSTMSASRSSKPSAAMSGCLRCSSSALAMPVSPRATSRSCVGCVSIVSPFRFLLTRRVFSPDQCVSGSSHDHGCWRAGSAGRPALSSWRRLCRDRAAGST